MKISKKAIVTLCIIVSILAIVLFCVLWFNQKPNFSKYHSYAVVTENGDIPLTDGQFQKIAELYKNDETMYIATLFEDAHMEGYKLKLYKTADMSGNYLTVYTGSSAPITGITHLKMGNKAFGYDEGRDNIARQIETIIAGAIEQYESEQKE